MDVDQEGGEYGGATDRGVGTGRGGGGAYSGLHRAHQPYEEEEEEEDETVGTDDKPAVVNTQSVKEVRGSCRLTHPINTRCHLTLSTHPINTPSINTSSYQHTLSTHPSNTPYQHTLAIHPINTP